MYAVLDIALPSAVKLPVDLPAPQPVSVGELERNERWRDLLLERHYFRKSDRKAKDAIENDSVLDKGEVPC
jgi:hypothetical protein